MYKRQHVDTGTVQVKVKCASGQAVLSTACNSIFSKGEEDGDEIQEDREVRERSLFR